MLIGKVYKITNKTTDQIYIGSCVMELKKRLNSHFNSAKFNGIKANKFHKALLSEEENPRDNWEIVLLNEVYTDKLLNQTKKEIITKLRLKELEYLEIYKKIGSSIILNSNKPIRTGGEYKEYYLKNREKLISNQKKYNSKNKEKIKQYYVKTREKRLIYQREYNLNNKEKRINYYKDNKAKIQFDYTCECGKIIKNTSKYKHFKSKKHIKLMSKTD